MKLSKIIAAWICVAAIAVLPTAYAADFDTEKAMESVFVLHDDNAAGSAFAIGENVIITNAHVVDDLSEYNLLTNSSDEQHKAFLIGKDTEMDIAVLGVEDMTFTPLPTADYTDMMPGDDVYALGSPKGLFFAVTKGVLSVKQQNLGSYDYIQSDTFTHDGNSGGPLLNSEGKVIGVNTFRASNTDNITFSLPIKNAIEFVNSLGLKTDENGNVIGRADKSMEAAPEPETSSPAESDDGEYVQAHPVITAEQIALIGVIIAVVAIIADVIAILALRRTNERLRLFIAQQRAKDTADKKSSDSNSDNNAE